IAQLPRDLEESLNAYWREASSDVQFVLSLAALLGSRFPTVPVIGAASALGARSAANAMQASRTPLSIVRSSSEFVDLFTEPGFAAIAKRHAEELLAPEDEQVLMEAVESHAEDLANKILQEEPVDLVAAELSLNLHVGYALSEFLSAEPASRSALSLSILYWESGRSNEALQSCNNGVVLAANAPAELLTIKFTQVNLLRRSGFFDEAVKVLAEVKALVDSAGGDIYFESAIEHQKCVLLLDQGHYFEAKSALHECVATFEGKISNERRQSFLILSAIAALECHEPEEARSQLERITSEWENRAVEPDLRHQVESLLAAALILAGHPDEGRKVLDHLVDSSAAISGEDHTTTLILRLNRLATLSPHHDESSVDEARHIAQQLDKTPDILHKVEAHIVLHEILLNRGQLSEPTAELPALVEQARTRLGADHPLSLRVTNLFGQVLLESGDLPQADAVLRECLATTTDALGPDNPDILKPLHNLTYTVWKSEKWREAVELVDRLIAETRRLVPSENLFGPLSIRSHSYAQMENWLEAKKAAAELVEYLSIEPVRNLAALLQAKYSLAKAHVHLGEHGTALACLEELHHQVTNVLEPEESLVIRASHGAAVVNSGDLARGARLLAEVRHDAKQLLGDSHPLTRSITEQTAAASADQSEVLPIQNRAARRAAARRRKP
ncbi:MAG: tetratricopeptide repeat protein, partial [Actinomycetota bacterium]|nr:tetratricopeptide repeat protein [Actinomycetota bacterium]